MRLRKLIFLVGTAFLAALLCSCSDTSLPADESSPPPTDYSSSVRVVVTSDFGKEIFVEETVVIGESTTALDALQQVAEVKTKHGGGFVSAIDGISSEYGGVNRDKRDWLFYINGMSVNIGAGQYILHPGDTEHWDFREWSFRQFVPAIIGDFPEPFLHGYGGVAYPTVIAYQDGWEGEARQIANRLNQLGVESISLKNADELLADEKESGNLILLGTSDCQLIGEINQPWNRLGFYCHFQDGSLEVFNAAGDLAAEYEAGAGVIQATQNPWNPKGIGACENVVWMLSGLDETGVRAAIDALINHYNDFEYAYAVVVANEEVIKVP